MDADVLIAMRYWNPLTADTAKIVAAGKYDKIVLLPLYPHYSMTTTGSSYNEWKKAFKADVSTVYIRSYQADENYVAALNQRIDEGILKFPEDVRKSVQLVFSAHGTPVSYIKKGDPYSFQIQQTVHEAMKKRNHDLPYHMCYQSKVGPMKWLEPSTGSMIKKLAEEGRKNLLIIPVSFVSDHVETLFELNIEYRHIADACGIENYIVMTGLNDSKLFIESLYHLVKKYL